MMLEKDHRNMIVPHATLNDPKKLFCIPKSPRMIIRGHQEVSKVVWLVVPSDCILFSAFTAYYCYEYYNILATTPSTL